jgi:3-hydroxyacyl-CoA dehydrogenase
MTAVAVVGTGTIGASWAALFLARGLDVVAHDPAQGARERMLAAVDEAWPALMALGVTDRAPQLDRLRWSDDLDAAVVDAAFVQESGPELLDLKQELVARIDRAAPPATVLATSSSGLRPTDVAATCTSHPERVLVGHPFHPAHVVPLVEVVGGERTSAAAVDDALLFYTGLGKRPVHVRQELPGHVANRLQAALWREAYDLVARGAATVADVDAVITNGPGLRWAAVGPFAGHHLSGGAGGIAHNLEHLGAPMVAWWDDLRTPVWTDELVDRVIAQMADELGTTTPEQLSAARDRLLVTLLAAKAAETGLTT